MRNITFVIAFFMLSMFSVHAQHIYYKLDRESNALQQIPETNELKQFTMEMPNQYYLASKELYLPTPIDENAPLTIIVSNYDDVNTDILNAKTKMQEGQFLLFVGLSLEDSIANLNLEEYNNLSYVFVHILEDISDSEIFERINGLVVATTTNVIVGKGCYH